LRTIASRLRALGLPFDQVPYQPPKGTADNAGAAVVVTGIGRGTRTLYFSGHYDVVPVIESGQCTPVLRGKTLFGRGSADMKSGLASMLYALVVLERLRAPLKGRVRLLFVPDEETGGRRGSAYLSAKKHLGADGIGMLTAEPTSGVIWNANRGALTLRVTVHGREAHVGLLHQGRNAFEDAVRVVADLQRLARRVARRRTRFRITPDAARRSLMLIGGRVEAGSNFNVVPGRCSFTVDRRMNPEEDFETERAALFGVLDKARAAGIRLDIEVLQQGRPSGTPEDEPLGRSLRDHVRAVTGTTPRFEICPGLLEIRFYAERRMPAYAYGPGLLAVSHGPKEFVHINRIVECAAIYARTALSVLTGS
jgi:acetylornithine deacetylase/succinyl-diaminopimelate desuccinylase-like protein